MGGTSPPLLRQSAFDFLEGQDLEGGNPTANFAKSPNSTRHPVTPSIRRQASGSRGRRRQDVGPDAVRRAQGGAVVDVAVGVLQRGRRVPRVGGHNFASKICDIAGTPLCVAGRASSLPPILQSSCGARQIHAEWTIFCKLEHGSRITLNMNITGYSAEFASPSRQCQEDNILQVETKLTSSLHHCDCYAEGCRSRVLAGTPRRYLSSRRSDLLA